MTESKARRSASSRARAAIKAQRWALSKERAAPRRGPLLLVAAAIAGGVTVGGALSMALTPAGTPGAPETQVAERDRESLPDPIAEARLARSRPPLVPAAGPESGRGNADHLDGLPPLEALGRMAYEEPFVPEQAARALSDREIEAAIGGTVAAGIEPPRPPAETPAWRRNAVRVARFEGRPMIAVVIDDLGLNRPNARRAIALPAPLTLAFMTYAPGLEELTTAARALGHELMVHVPMEPSHHAYDPGPNALRIAQDPEQVASRLDWALSRFDGYVGINNHMGSRFTASPAAMAQVMAALRSRGLLFLDSRTSPASIGAELAARMGVAHAARDVFIDNQADSPRAIRDQLAKLESIARREGRAVGIGHPHDATLEVLRDWLAEVRGRGFALVPISAIVDREIEIARRAAAADRYP